MPTPLLVAFAVRAPVVIFMFAFALMGAGLWSYKELDIEAYPNPVPPLVEIIAQPDGTSAEDVERYVTVPIEIGLAGMPGLDHVRSQSLFGLSDVKCYFTWDIDYKDARQEVIKIGLQCRLIIRRCHAVDARRAILARQAVSLEHPFAVDQVMQRGQHPLGTLPRQLGYPLSFR